MRSEPLFFLRFDNNFNNLREVLADKVLYSFVTDDKERIFSKAI